LCNDIAGLIPPGLSAITITILLLAVVVLQPHTASEGGIASGTALDICLTVKYLDIKVHRRR